LAGQSLERSYTLRMAAAVAGKQYRKDEDHAARQISQVHVWHPIAEQAIFPRLRFTLVVFVISSKLSRPVNDHDRNATGKSEGHSSLFRWNFITIASAFRFSAHPPDVAPTTKIVTTISTVPNSL
jgi:hypothetical protein